MHEFPIDGPITLTAKIAAGRLAVTAEPRDTATVEIVPFDASEASRDAVARTRVDLSGDVLTVESPRMGWWPRRGRIRVEVRLPEGSRLNVSLASAEGHLTGRYGDASVHSASGDIAVDHVAGTLDLETASGDARVNRVDGPAKVRTASGDIAVGHTGGDVNAATASGDITVGRAESSVRVRTASGDVGIGSARHGTVEIAGASGDLRVGIETGTRVWLDVSTVSGTLRSDLDHMSVNGPADEGAALTVRARTASGNVDLRRVPAEASHV
jgi:hypothetical protein